MSLKQVLNLIKELPLPLQEIYISDKDDNHLITNATAKGIRHSAKHVLKIHHEAANYGSLSDKQRETLNKRLKQAGACQSLIAETANAKTTQGKSDIALRDAIANRLGVSAQHLQMIHI